MPDNNTPNRPLLLPHHHEHLRASGLTDATIATAGLFSTTDPTEAARALNWHAGGPVPSLAFPYTDIDSSVVQTILRPDTPRVREDGSVAKYEQPAGEPHRIYFPPTLTKAAFLDTNRPLIFTEGIKKALAAVQAGGVAVSAQGVSVWHDADHRAVHIGKPDEWKLRDGLRSVPLTGRRVYVAFDGGDTTSNPPVVLAEARLARMLLDAGADVRLVRIPFQPGGPKIGLDDFLSGERQPDSALATLLSNALPAKPAARVDQAMQAPAADDAIEALLRDLSFAGALRVGGSTVVDLVAGKLRKVHVTKAAIDEALARFAECFVQPQAEKVAGQLGRGEVKPDEQPQPSAPLLADLVALFELYAVLPEGAAVALALWVLHTWAFEAALFTPRIAIISPTKGCGKSTVLDLLRALCRRAVMSANVSAAALYRLVQAQKPTLLIDEADSFLSEREELRGVLNAGYEVNGEVLRCAGDDHEPTTFSCFAPVAIAAIGQLPGTIADRSLVVSMERKPRDSEVARRDREARRRLEAVKPRLARWAQDSTAQLTGAHPELPEALTDRQRDICEPLLAIADHAGGEWPGRARSAVGTLCRVAATESGDLRERLLAAVWALFASAAFLTLKEIVERLLADETGGWDTVSTGRPITTSALARWLAPFGVRSTQPSTGNAGRGRGLRRSDLEPVVARYLAPFPVAGRVGVSPQTCAASQRTDGGATPQQHADTAFAPGAVVEGVL